MTEDSTKIVNELSNEEESQLEKNLVWIFASRRSGTSWFSNQLLSFNTLHLNEPLIGIHLADFVPSGKTLERRIDKQSTREHYFFSEAFKKTWKHYLRKLILNRINAQFQNTSSKIIIKEPNGSAAADIISECLPSSKIIILLRDGRDILNSNISQISEGGYAVKTGIRSTPLLEKNRIKSINSRSRIWVKLIEILLKTFENHNKELRIKVRYEDLRQNTLQELKKIYEFLKIDITDEKLQEIISKYSFENLTQE